MFRFALLLLALALLDSSRAFAPLAFAPRSRGESVARREKVGSRGREGADDEVNGAEWRVRRRELG